VEEEEEEKEEEINDTAASPEVALVTAVDGADRYSAAFGRDHEAIILSGDRVKK